MLVKYVATSFLFVKNCEKLISKKSKLRREGEVLEGGTLARSGEFYLVTRKPLTYSYCSDMMID